MPTPNPNAVPVNLQPGYNPAGSGLDIAASQLQGQNLAPREPARYEPPDNDGAGPSFYADNDYIDPYTQPEFYERLTNQLPGPGWEEQAFDGPQVDPTKIPNYEKLSGPEKWLMAQTAGWKNTPWGQAAEKFATNPVVQFIGKGLEPVLGAFDVGAEALERGTGFASQALDAYSKGGRDWEDFAQNMQSAWYAGSLAADMATSIKHNQDISSPSAFLNGFSWDDDLPGNDGLIKARQRIADVVAQGGTFREGLETARAEYMDSLGALAFRAQIKDTGFHLLADPLNILLPMIKPVQWSQSARIKLANLADAEGLERIAANLADANKALDAAKATGDAKAIATATEALSAARQIEQDYSVARKLSWGEQMMVRLFGGGENLSQIVSGEKKLTGLGKLLTPFQLTPQAKAQQYFSNILDNFLNYYITPNVGRGGEIDFVGLARDMQRVADGTLDPRLAHMIVTPEGRATRTAMEGLSNVAQAIATQRQLVSNVERPLFDLVKDALGVTPTALMKRITAGEVDAILRQVATKLQADPTLIERLRSISQRAGVAPDALLTPENFGAKMATLNVPGAPVYDDQLMLLELATQMGEATAKRAITQFGLKERGLATAFTDALKSAESLAYLRLNPTYPIRNKLNNVVTMIARGTFGMMSPTAINDYWKAFGSQPARLFSGLGPAEVAAKLIEGDTVHALAQAGAKGGQAIADVTKGKGVFRKFEDAVGRFGDAIDPMLGKLGFGGQTAANYEARAGALATTIAHQEGRQLLGKAGGGILAKARDIMDPGVARGIGDTVISKLEGLASSARTPAELDELVSGPNWNLDIDNIITQAESKLGGMTLTDALGQEFKVSLGDKLRDAVKGGEQATRDFFEQLYAQTERHIQDLTNAQVRDLALEVQARVTAEGPRAGVDLYNQALDTLRATESAHTLRMAELADIARRAPNKQSSAIWQHIKARENALFENTWKRMEAMTDGIAKAAKDAGFDGAPITTALKNWKASANKFFTGRDKLINEFWDAIANGKEPRLKWDEIQAINDEAYDTFTAVEKANVQKLDRAVAELVPSGPERDLFLAWREKLLAFRETDVQLVKDFRQELAKIRGTDARYQAYLTHGQDRQALRAAAYQEYRNGLQAIKGNPRAQAQYTDLIQASQEELLQGYSAFDKINAEQALSPEEAAAWKRVVDKFAEPDEIARLREIEAATAKTFSDNTDKLVAEANKLGIATATESGRPSLARLLNTLNKHRAKEIAPFSLAEIRNGLTDQRLAEAQYSLALRSWEPDPIRRAIRENAGYLRSQLGDYQGPAMITKDADDLGLQYTRLGSGRPDWLQRLSADSGYSYKELYKALGEIADGKVRKSKARQIVEEFLQSAGAEDINPITGVARSTPQAPELPESIYHATPRDFEGLPISQTGLGGEKRRMYGEPEGVFYSRSEAEAKQATGYGESQRTVGAFPNAKKPFIVSQANSKEYDDLYKQAAKNAGFDGKGSLEDWFSANYGKDAETAREFSGLLKEKGYDAVYDTRNGDYIALSESAVVSEKPITTKPPSLENYLPDRSDAVDLATERLDLERDIFARYMEQTQARAFPEAVEPPSQAYIPSLTDVGIKPEPYLSEMADHAFNQHGQFAVDALRDSTLQAMREPPLNLGTLTAEQAREVRRYIAHAKSAIPTINSSALKFAQWKRDASLLNYSRRTNFDSWLGMVAPYSFWTSASAYNWALHSIDRPAMLSSYYRINKWLREAYNPQPGAPTRFKGNLRIRLPFMPDWMGDQFIDPFSVALPFDNWQQPFENLEAQEARDQGTARRKLDELLDAGEISQSDYDTANGSQAGATWERAMALAQQDDKENRYDALDFATAFANPHTPLLWAFNALRGKKDVTGGNTFLPITRSISAASQALRIAPMARPMIPPGGWNIEAGLRQALGLHPMLDKWQDYRVDRELANMVADGEITVDEAKRAMIDRTGPAYDRARDREGYQRVLTTGTGFLGVPVRSYPTGEEYLRNLADDYARAWQAYDAGDETKLDAFNEKYPEYEARLGLYKQPDERMRDFLIDGLWDKWNGLTSLHKRQISEQLGPLFERAFLDKELRDYESISDATMGTWLKLMGGDPPGSLSTTRNDVPPLDLAPMEVAQSVQEFYDQRKLYFPDYRELQDQYFALPEKGSERKAFRNANPQLVSYWDWRREWLDQNPEAAVYLTDNSSSGKDTTTGGGGGQPYSYSTRPGPVDYSQLRQYPTGEELRALIGDEVYALLGDAATGQPLPDVAQSLLQPAIQQYGLSVDQLAQISVGGNPGPANDGYWFDNRINKWRSGPEDADGPIVQAWFDNRIGQWRLGYEDANPPGQILGVP